MSATIQPTNGRIIWFTPAKNDPQIATHGAPLAAVVAAVNGDGTLNLAVFDAYGTHHPRCNVPIRDPENDILATGYFAEWMPYQLTQARRAVDGMVAGKEPSQTAFPVTKVLGRADQPSEQALEAEIAAKGLDAPRLTPALIDNAIAKQDFYVFPGTNHTVCCLTLVNGFTVVGDSAAASSENFDPDIGRRKASADARAKIWGYEGYRLKQALYERDNGLAGLAVGIPSPPYGASS